MYFSFSNAGRNRGGAGSLRREGADLVSHRQKPTHQQQIARLVRAESGWAYNRALDLVRDAAARGLLPSRLDKAGRTAAVRIVLARRAAAGASPALPGSPARAVPSHDAEKALAAATAQLLADAAEAELREEDQWLDILAKIEDTVSRAREQARDEIRRPASVPAGPDDPQGGGTSSLPVHLAWFERCDTAAAANLQRSLPAAAEELLRTAWELTPVADVLQDASYRRWEADRGEAGLHALYRAPVGHSHGLGAMPLGLLRHHPHGALPDRDGYYAVGLHDQQPHWTSSARKARQDGARITQAWTIVESPRLPRPLRRALTHICEQYYENGNGEFLTLRYAEALYDWLLPPV
ncbi:hypothetical protein [Kitasatospora sp. NPDC088783]|uniref:hypothetical protein n=1 Tax=Kitasatospora sp. NPDC088783 TaxID=3364077 RepID=UPI00380AB659